MCSDNYYQSYTLYRFEVLLKNIEIVRPKYLRRSDQRSNINLFLSLSKSKQPPPTGICTARSTN